MKVETLPSGNKRVRVKYKDPITGKVCYESFTSHLASDALYKANKFKETLKRQGRNDLTVYEAIEGYIGAKDHILSPATIRGYALCKNRLAWIKDQHIQRLTSVMMQSVVNQLCKEYSAKTVRNTYGLLQSAITFYLPEQTFSVALPESAPERDTVPEDRDIRLLLDNTDGTIRLAICLCGFCSIRRSAVCALKYKDIDKDTRTIHVHAAVVKDRNGKWVYKDRAKTPKSNRVVIAPQFVIDMIGDGDPEDYVLGVYPDTITREFINAKKRLGIENITYHDMRAFYATVMAEQGIPDFYTAQSGGWAKNSPILKRVYQRVRESTQSEYAAKASAYFDGFISGATTGATEKLKAL